MASMTRRMHTAATSRTRHDSLSLLLLIALTPSLISPQIGCSSASHTSDIASSPAASLRLSSAPAAPSITPCSSCIAAPRSSSTVSLTLASASPRLAPSANDSGNSRLSSPSESSTLRASCEPFEKSELRCCAAGSAGAPPPSSRTASASSE
eukprot:4568753-Prymnesium_polylepis.1